MPGYKVYLQDGGEIREGLTCSYCKLVLKDPVQTSENGLRLCKECYKKAKNDEAVKFDPNDKVWPDSAVEREIANLKVKCENYKVGCDWEGLFKQLMQHSQQCQYVTVECRNPGCGRVLLTKMEEHLKQGCPRRRVKCKDCGKEIHFIELKDHTGECPNAPRACKYCRMTMPASKLADHMIHECKYVRCVCKNDGTIYEAGSTKFHSHLQDVSKLADHLGPMIREFTKMSEAFKEMSTAYQQATKRIDELEKGHQEYLQRIEMLERKKNELEGDAKQTVKIIEVADIICELQKRIEILEKKVKELQKQNSAEIDKLKRDHAMSIMSPRLPVFEVPFEDYYSDPIKKLQEKFMTLDNNLQEIKRNFEEHDHNNALPPSSVMYDDLRSYIKQVEEKMLEQEWIFNAVNAHNAELELQLQASLASTHNGAFLWRIPEVCQRIREAEIGRTTSINSPPFYTGRNGYKMCIRAYLNGDGTGEEMHLSIFFVLMKGEYDPLLQWPFKHKVSLILVDQDHKRDLVHTLVPDTQSSSFQQPRTDINDPSGCSEFSDFTIPKNTGYVKDDVMYIRTVVDTSEAIPVGCSYDPIVIWLLLTVLYVMWAVFNSLV